ncbi:eukaryotic translation initiation factor 5A-2, partial [Tanacetum coccineum]
VVKVDYKVDPVRKCTRFDFVAQDIFYGHVHKYSATGNERCEVPFIHDMFYRIEDIYGDGRLVLRTVNGAKKVGPDLILPYDDQSLSQTRVDFYKRKKILHVDVKSAMGEEHVTCLKELTEQPPRKRMVIRIR